MDRELAPEITRRTRRKQTLWILLLVGTLGSAVFLFQRFLRTSVEAARIRSAVVEVGPVENTLTATGEVIPAFEQVITSPIRARIRRVLLPPGTRVRPGQAILELDKSLTEIEFEKGKDQLALKRNGIEQLRLKLQKELHDAELNDEIKSLTISRLRADLEDIRRLQKVGGRTPEDVSQAEDRLRIAELEKKQLENNLAYNRNSMAASLRESTLQAQIESRNLEELDHKLKQANLVAERAGVLTWVNENLGTAVSEGEMLAKLADLGSFRVEGSCADVYAEQVSVGLPVIVKVNETSLRGLISQVRPAVKNGVLQFVIQLDDPRHAALRPNLKTEVFLVTQRSARAVRVPNGPAFKGKRRQSVFVLGPEGTARRREVEVGLSNFDFVEIKAGLQPGERVILTDLSDYEHLDELTIEPAKP
jgi:HlyD family secretion protein